MADPQPHSPGVSPWVPELGLRGYPSLPFLPSVSLDPKAPSWIRVWEPQAPAASGVPPPQAFRVHSWGAAQPLAGSVGDVCVCVCALVCCDWMVASPSSIWEYSDIYYDLREVKLHLEQNASLTFLLQDVISSFGDNV